MVRIELFEMLVVYMGMGYWYWHSRVLNATINLRGMQEEWE